jgi:hypothetical protein
MDIGWLGSPTFEEIYNNWGFSINDVKISGILYSVSEEGSC